MEKIIANEILQTIRLNQLLLAIPVRQKSKFEQWLKFELAFRLRTLYSDTEVEYMEKSANGNKYIDIYTNNSYLELKTTCTNIAHSLSPNRKGHNKPITKNINDIIADIKDLRGYDAVRKGNKRGYVATIFFPYDESQSKHVQRLKKVLGNTALCEIDTDINTVPVRIFVSNVQSLPEQGGVGAEGLAVGGEGVGLGGDGLKV